MPRPTKKKLDFTQDSLNQLIQEIYTDTYNVRSDIRVLLNKWSQMVNTGGEVAAIGKNIVDLIKVEVSNNEQKLVLAKYLKEVVYAADKDGKIDNKSTPVLSGSDKSEILKRVKDVMNDEK